jgi:hypothetical protein
VTDTDVCISLVERAEGGNFESVAGREFEGTRESSKLARLYGAARRVRVDRSCPTGAG